MKIILFPVLALILTACGTAAQPIAPTTSAAATIPPTVTLTATPIFTPTPTLTLAETQALAAVNDAFGGDLTVEADGDVTDKNGQARTDLRYDLLTNETVLLVDGQWIAINPADVSFDQDGNVDAIAGYEHDENGWVEQQVTVKEYPVVAIKDYQTNTIPLEDLYPVGSAEVGEFTRTAESKAQPFLEGQLDQRPWTRDSRNVLHPDPSISRVPGTVTAHLGFTTGIVEMDGMKYMVIPFEIPDPSDPTNPEKNIQLTGFKLQNHIKNGAFDSPYYAADVKFVVDVLSNGDIGIFPMIADYHYPGMSLEVPLAKRTWDTIGKDKMDEIIARVLEGDVAALRDLRGMPVMVDVTDSKWYK